MPPKEDAKLKLAMSQKNSVLTNGSKDGSVKSGQVAAKSIDAQKVINPNDLFASAEGGAKTGHGTPPTNAAAASESATGGPEDTEMEDATVRDKNDSARIAELESLLRSEKDANINLQRTIAEYESGSTGQRTSLVERAQEIGFVRDASGKLSLGSPASQGFDYSKPYTYINRWG